MATNHPIQPHPLLSRVAGIQYQDLVTKHCRHCGREVTMLAGEEAPAKCRSCSLLGANPRYLYTYDDMRYRPKLGEDLPITGDNQISKAFPLPAMPLLAMPPDPVAHVDVDQIMADESRRLMASQMGDLSRKLVGVRAELEAARDCIRVLMATVDEAQSKLVAKEGMNVRLVAALVTAKRERDAIKAKLERQGDYAVGNAIARQFR